MSAYHYAALKQSGRSCNGVIEADSERHARALLRAQGLIPTAVSLTGRATQSTSRYHLSAQDLALITRQLATLLAAGIPIEESLRGVGEQTEKQTVRQLIIGVRANVMEGYSLAQAMNEFPTAFPELYRATISAGEQTGRLDLILEKLADYTEKQQQTRHKIQQALIYPALMIIVSFSIVCFLLVFVVPKIIEVFTSSGQSLPTMTRLLIGISAYLKADGVVIGVVLIILGMIAKKSLSYAHIRMRWERFLLTLPLIAYLIRSTNVARYIHTFSILFAAGVSVLDTMRVSASVVTNLVMKAALDKAAVQVKEGTAIHLALKETRFLNPMALHLIASGERSGQLAPMMVRAAVQLDQDVQRLIDTGLSLLEPLIILFMGAVVLFIVLATLLPIFSMQQLV